MIKEDRLENLIKETLDKHSEVHQKFIEAFQEDADLFKPSIIFIMLSFWSNVFAALCADEDKPEKLLKRLMDDFKKTTEQKIDLAKDMIGRKKH